MDSGKKRVLVTGSSGMLGAQMVSAFAEAGWQVFGVDCRIDDQLVGVRQFKLDLTDRDAVKDCLEVVEPELIVHCAAIVSLQLCEDEPKMADKMHRAVTETLVSFQPDGSRLIYVSTDSVFDGISGGYSEDDVPQPLNEYARTKLAGERAALRNPLNLVLRTNIYGFRPCGGNSLAEWLISEFNKGNGVSGFTDTIFNPLYTVQLAHVTVALSNNRAVNGIINAASSEPVSKYEFACRLADKFGYDKALVRPAEMNSMPANIERPLNTSLKTGKLAELLGTVPSLDKGLEWFKKDYESCKDTL